MLIEVMYYPFRNHRRRRRRRRRHCLKDDLLFDNICITVKTALLSLIFQ